MNKRNCSLPESNKDKSSECKNILYDAQKHDGFSPLFIIHRSYRQSLPYNGLDNAIIPNTYIVNSKDSKLIDRRREYSRPQTNEKTKPEVSSVLKIRGIKECIDESDSKSNIGQKQKRFSTIMEEPQFSIKQLNTQQTQLNDKKVKEKKFTNSIFSNELFQESDKEERVDYADIVIGTKINSRTDMSKRTSSSENKIKHKKIQINKEILRESNKPLKRIRQTQLSENLKISQINIGPARSTVNESLNINFDKFKILTAEIPPSAFLYKDQLHPSSLNSECESVLRTSKEIGISKKAIDLPAISQKHKSIFVAPCFYTVIYCII